MTKGPVQDFGGLVVGGAHPPSGCAGPRKPGVSANGSAISRASAGRGRSPRPWPARWPSVPPEKPPFITRTRPRTRGSGWPKRRWPRPAGTPRPGRTGSNRSRTRTRCARRWPGPRPRGGDHLRHPAARRTDRRSRCRRRHRRQQRLAMELVRPDGADDHLGLAHQLGQRGGIRASACSSGRCRARRSAAYLRQLVEVASGHRPGHRAAARHRCCSRYSATSRPVKPVAPKTTMSKALFMPMFAWRAGIVFAPLEHR